MFCTVKEAREEHWCQLQEYEHCKGNACMMWRWLDTERYEGYCGLAGAPRDLYKPEPYADDPDDDPETE